MQLSIPESFYQEEVRCDYTVSAKMKKIWAVELDLLYQLQQVCEKYNIKYFASAGTMLGAVRHGGMIPWDDDIDIMMLRDQYDLLCSHADEFKDPYFFQTAHTDKGYFRGHAQLRNSNTTAILTDEADRHLPFNQGIFVDIFPLDVTVSDKKVLARQIRRMHYYQEAARRSFRNSDGYNPHNVSIRGKIAHYFMPLMNKIRSYDEYYDLYEKEMTRYSHLHTKYVSKLCFAPGDFRMYDEVSEFDDTVMFDFEMLQIPLPVGYEKHLVRQFGDYMKFVIGTTSHSGVIYDPDISYKEWFRQHPQT